jgi:uncharacterized protein
MFRRGRRNCCLALALLATAGVAQTASFDCNKATTEIEHAICRDPGLSQLDGQLGTVYRARLAQDPGLRSAQIAWIRERNQQCGPDVACITLMVQGRITQLEGSTVANEQTAANARPPSPQSAPVQSARSHSPPAPVVEIPQIEPLDLDRIERVQPPPPPPPKDPIEELVGSYFDASGGNFHCGQGWRSYRDNSDLAGIYDLDAAELAEPKFRSHRLSDSESAAFQAWQTCHLYATQQRWARLIPAISYTACSRAAASVNQGGGDEAQNGLVDVLDDLKSSCSSYAEQAEAGAQFMASVRRLADRVNLVATETANRTLAQYGEQKRQIAEAATRDAALAKQQRVQRETAEAERAAAAAKRAEESRNRNAEIAAAQSIEDQRVAAANKKECDAVLKDEDTINRIALQILDRTYEGGTCAQSMQVCHQLTTAFVAACSFSPASEVARCLVRQVHGCGGGS